ncbi:MAG: hypothetical protein LQ351_007043 [Letrouitia transgressa]|nr:MAG: hypothetical protein LQ351_007043 [Letrouitia transgressa]
MSVLFYRRPDYVAKLPGPMNLAQCQPCTLQDFMDYLVYVSHDAENLQFWLWLQEYTKKFYSAPPSEQALSMPWTPIDPPQTLGQDPSQLPSRTFDKQKIGVTQYEINFDQPDLPMSPAFDKQSFTSGVTNSNRSANESVEDAYAQAGLKWHSFTIQPFRSEINRVISHYLAPNAPRELNLSHKTRAAVLHALQHTTHPSAFSIVRDMVEGTLRGQSHPNFIRWSICNGNKPRVLFVRNSGIAHVIGAIILAVFLVLSGRSRWWRLFVVPLFLVGFSIGVAAYKGLCVIVHSTHSRGLRPWEQFGDAASLTSFDADDEATLSTDEVYSMSHRSKRAISMDTFGTSNSFDHELWVEKYKKKPLLQRIFTKQIWVQDETIRLLQDRIVIQSYIWSVMLTIPLTALIVALPVFHVI